MSFRCRLIVIAVALLTLTGFAGSAQAAEGGRWYVRAGLGWYQSGDADFSDVNCVQTQPPAFFGCQIGNNGQPIGARGDFGNGVAVDAGIGHRFLPWLRGEVLLAYDPNLDYSGSANFLKVSGKQSVSGSGESFAVLAVAWFDLPAIGRWRPYLGLGAGAARNHIGPMTYEFPGLGPGDYTRTSGGSHTDFAWMVGAGVTITISQAVSLDFGIRYTDRGEVRTASGPITVARDAQTFVFDAGATRADLHLTRLALALRYRF